jgi:hypothetical protein
MAVSSDRPFLYAGRSAGLRFLGDPADPCANPTSSVGTQSAGVRAESVFDDWGYVHPYDAASMAEVGRDAIPEALDPRYAEGFGDVSVHEVATDSRRDLADCPTTRAGCV